MTVKELKTYLETLDENLEVCFMQNGGHGCGNLPVEVKPKVAEVQTYYEGKKKMLIVNAQSL